MQHCHAAADQRSTRNILASPKLYRPSTSTLLIEKRPENDMYPESRRSVTVPSLTRSRSTLVDTYQRAVSAPGLIDAEVHGQALTVDVRKSLNQLLRAPLSSPQYRRHSSLRRRPWKSSARRETTSREM